MKKSASNLIPQNFIFICDTYLNPKFISQIKLHNDNTDGYYFSIIMLDGDNFISPSYESESNRDSTLQHVFNRMERK